MDILRKGMVPICLSSLAKASWFTSNSFSKSSLVVFIYLVHPANLVSCNAQSHVVGLPHLPWCGVEVFPREFIHVQSTSFRVSCGDIIETPLCSVWVRWFILPYHGFPGEAHNLMDCAYLTVLTRTKHTHCLAIVDVLMCLFDLLVITMLNTPETCNSIIHNSQSFICITLWVLRSVFEGGFKHTTLANVWFSLCFW